MRTLIILTLSFMVLGAAEERWSIDKPADAIDDVPLTGSLWGRALALEKVAVNDHAITFTTTRTVGKMWPDAEVILFIGKDELADKVVTPADAGMLPHIHMRFSLPGKDFPDTLMYTGVYSMRLQVVEKTDAEVKMRIHLSLPDCKHSHLYGTFTAKVK